MSTCPDKDIHSLYLDNELPVAYVAEYEQHLASCPKCQSELARIRSLHTLLAADSSSISLTAHEVDASFDRLQARLSYKKVAHKPIILGSAVRSVIKDMCIGAAAAAVIAVILPLRQNNIQRSNASFTPVARQSSFNLPASAVSVDGAVTPVALSTFLGEDEDSKMQVLHGASLQAQSAAVAAVMPFGNAFIPAVESENIDRMSLTSYDVFSPLEETSEQEVQASAQKDSFFNLSSLFVSLDAGTDK